MSWCVQTSQMVLVLQHRQCDSSYRAGCKQLVWDMHQVRADSVTMHVSLPMLGSPLQPQRNHAPLQCASGVLPRRINSSEVHSTGAD